LSGETSFQQNPPPSESFHPEGDDPVREEGSPLRASPSGATEHEVKHRNIFRYDSVKKREHAWRVFFRRRNEIMTRCFSDGVHGGRDKALAAAIAYRDQLLSCHSEFEHQIWRWTRLRKDNTSGIPGVGRYEATDPNTGRRHAFWLASWFDEHGMKRQRKYCVLRRGDASAKRLAVAEREHQLLLLCERRARYIESQRKPPDGTAEM
jgi:hypothetical protein